MDEYNPLASLKVGDRIEMTVDKWGQRVGARGTVVKPVSPGSRSIRARMDNAPSPSGYNQSLYLNPTNCRPAPAEAPASPTLEQAVKIVAESLRRASLDKAFGSPANAAAVRAAMMNNTCWSEAAPLSRIFSAIYWAAGESVGRLEDAEKAHAGTKDFMAPCPQGFGTVLGHLSLQGKQPEDVGMAEGRRLSRLAKEEGVAETWVRASPALRDICDRVRSYPAEFLVKHLGPVPDQKGDGAANTLTLDDLHVSRASFDAQRPSISFWRL